MTVEDIKEYRYKHWRDDLPVEEAYKEYVKEGKKMKEEWKEFTKWRSDFLYPSVFYILLPVAIIEFIIKYSLRKLREKK